MLDLFLHLSPQKCFKVLSGKKNKDQRPVLSQPMFILRPKAVAITAFVNWIANAIIGVSYPHINEAIGGAVFFIFGTFLFL